MSSRRNTPPGTRSAFEQASGTAPSRADHRDPAVDPVTHLEDLNHLYEDWLLDLKLDYPSLFE